MTPRGERPGTGEAVDGLVFKHEIAADTAISGKIHFPGDARIDGRLKGEVRADGLLVVGEKGVIQGSVRADRLILLGTIQGDVVRTRFAELHRGARLVGDVEVQNLAVHSGAILEGRCDVGREQPTVQESPRVILLERPIQARR